MCGCKDNNQGCHYSICRTVCDRSEATVRVAVSVLAVPEKVHKLPRLLATLANSPLPDYFIEDYEGRVFTTLMSEVQFPLRAASSRNLLSARCRICVCSKRHPGKGSDHSRG